MSREQVSRVTRWVAAPGSMGTVLGLLLATVAIAATLPALGFLSVFPKLSSLDYSPDTFGRIAPLRAEFIEDALGKDALARILRGLSGEKTGPVKQQVPPSPNPGGGDGGRLLPPILPGEGDARLRPSMTADRRSARPGDPIVYTVTIRNVGTDDFKAPLQIDAHFPSGTTYFDTPCKGSAPGGFQADPDPDDPPGRYCLIVPAPFPGDDAQHGYNHAIATKHIPMGGAYSERFRVTVNPGVPSGTKLRNHVHVTALHQQVTSNTVTVTVR